MKTKIVGLVIALLMLGAFTSAAVSLVRADDAEDRTTSSQAREKHTKKDKSDDDRGRHLGKGHQKGDRGSDAKDDQDDKDAWKDYWRSLTPAQRAATMARLAQEHADGVKKWAACVKDAGDDRAARLACERPVPPGIAKKQLRR